MQQGKAVGELPAAFPLERTLRTTLWKSFLGSLGRFEPGWQMDAVLLEEESPSSLFYHVAAPHARAVWKKGRLVFKKEPACNP